MPKGFNLLKKSLESLTKSDAESVANYARGRKAIDSYIEDGAWARACQDRALEESDMVKMATLDPEKTYKAVEASHQQPLPSGILEKFYEIAPDWAAKSYDMNPRVFTLSAKINNLALEGKLPGVNPIKAIGSKTLDPEVAYQYIKKASAEDGIGMYSHIISDYLGDHPDVWKNHGLELFNMLNDSRSGLFRGLQSDELSPMMGDDTRKTLLDAANLENGVTRPAKYLLRGMVNNLANSVDVEGNHLKLSPETSAKLLPHLDGMNADTQSAVMANIPYPKMLAILPEVVKTNPRVMSLLAFDERTTPENFWDISRVATDNFAFLDIMEKYSANHEIPSKIGFIKSAPPEIQKMALRLSPKSFYDEPAFRQMAMQEVRKDPNLMGVVADNITDVGTPQELLTLDTYLPEGHNIKPRIQQRLKEHGEYDDPTKVAFSFGTGKLRQLRALAEEKGGMISGKEAKQLGLDPETLGINKLKDAKGNISADILSQHIESIPKHEYGVSFTKYGSEDSDPDCDDEDSRSIAAMDAASEDFERERKKEEPDYEDDFANQYEEPDYEYADDLTDEENEAVDRKLRNLTSSKYTHDPKLSPAANARVEEWLAQSKDSYEDAKDSYVKSMKEEREREREDAYERWLENVDYDRYMPAKTPAADIYENMCREQRHSHEQSHVFQLNLTRDQMRQLKAAGAYESFRDLHKKFSNGNHPYSKGNGIGWLRYTEGPDGTHIDEVQSDFGQNFVKQLKGQLAAHEAQHGLTDDQREHAHQLIGDLEKVPPNHVDAINKIMFQGKHPSEVIHEAFLQHMRDTGKIGKNVHIWSAEPKSVLSRQQQDEALPVHMIEGYDKIPKKMGYKPAKYGELRTQKTGDWGEGAERGRGDIHLKGQPTWGQKLVKSEPGIGNKIGILSSGKEMFDKMEHPAHNDFDAKDHLEAAGLANKHLVRSFKKGLFSTARRFHNMYLAHISKYLEKNRPVKKKELL